MPPIWKICSSNGIISPRIGVKKPKNLSNHHLVLVFYRVVYISCGYIARFLKYHQLRWEFSSPLFFERKNQDWQSWVSCSLTSPELIHKLNDSIMYLALYATCHVLMLRKDQERQDFFMHQDAVIFQTRTPDWINSVAKTPRWPSPRSSRLCKDVSPVHTPPTRKKVTLNSKGL